MGMMKKNMKNRQYKRYMPEVEPAETHEHRPPPPKKPPRKKPIDKGTTATKKNRPENQAPARQTRSMTGHVPGPIERYQPQTVETAVRLPKRKKVDDDNHHEVQPTKKGRMVIDKEKITKSLTSMLPEHLKAIFQDHGVQSRKKAANPPKKQVVLVQSPHNQVSILQASSSLY